MLFVPALSLAMLLTPVNYGCNPTYGVPQVVVSQVRGNPSVSSDQSIAGLGQMSAGSYRPPGVGGPAWHTAGLTQSNIGIGTQSAWTTDTMGNGMSCIYMQKIQATVTLSPIVWVANDFSPGSCMYNAVRDHEMKHVNADRLVTDRHVDRIRAALTAVATGRVFFGPGQPQAVKAQLDQFQQQLDAVMKDEQQSFQDDEVRAQQAIDTMSEYQRVSHLCPGENR